MSRLYSSEALSEWVLYPCSLDVTLRCRLISARRDERCHHSVPRPHPAGPSAARRCTGTGQVICLCWSATATNKSGCTGRFLRSSPRPKTQNFPQIDCTENRPSRDPRFEFGATSSVVSSLVTKSIFYIIISLCSTWFLVGIDMKGR